jgi:hypothetical protein
MAMAPERPVHRIEDWDDESDSDFSTKEEEERGMPHTAAQSPIQVSQQAIVIQRPVAVKVIRPITITKRATEEFYSQAFDEGFAADAVHQAVMESHEWHRKWTMQEEEGHTHPHANYNATVASTSNGTGAAHAVPDHYAYQGDIAMDRAAGARNPSPEASLEDKDDALEQRKRIRSLEAMDRRSRRCLSSCSASDDEDQQDDTQDRMGSVVIEAQPPVSKRRIAEPEARVRQPAAASVAPVNTTIVRPVAVRIARPAAVAPVPPSRYTGSIPQNIQGALKRSDSSMSSMSGLSLPSVSPFQTQEADAVNQVNVVEDDGSMQVEEGPVQSVAIVHHPNAFSLKDATVTTARDGILQALAIAGGDVTSPKFQSCLQTLESYFNLTGVDTRSSSSRVASEGLWLTLTKPSFYANLGENDQGDPMYTLGRMSFDMFSPTSLVCSLQGNFNSVERVADTDRPGVLEAVPKGLREEVEAGNSVLRTYK